MDPVYQEVQSTIDRVLCGRDAPVILEAGCGMDSHFAVPGARLVGIDVSAKQLNRNKHLHEKIVGDIQVYALPASAYDAIVCWDVLEHLPRPEAALEHFARAVREDGLIVLGCPNVLSIKGLITKFTPYAFHVWIYRNVFRLKDAGKEDLAPFRTFLRLSIAPGRLVRFAGRHGLEVVLFRLYESRAQQEARQRSRLIDVVVGTLSAMCRVLTLNREDGMRSDCVLVLRRPAVARRTDPAPAAAEAQRASG